MRSARWAPHHLQNSIPHESLQSQTHLHIPLPQGRPILTLHPRRNDVVTGGPQVGARVFTDNDRLSALLASGAEADGLALLTDVDAVFDKPPDQVPTFPPATLSAAY